MAPRWVGRASLVVAATMLVAGCARRAPHAADAPRFERDGARYAVHGRGGWSAVVDQGALAFAPTDDAEPVVLRTSAIGRGEARALVGPARATLADDGAVRVERARGVTEELRADARGVEQSWRFDARPAGAGDLVVRVATAGTRAARADTAGATHLVRATGRGVRYGRATWVDARGARTDVAVRAVADALELTVPADVVERASYPAMLDPRVVAEEALEPAWPNAQLTPAIARGGVDFAAVWSTTDTDVTTLQNIYGESFAATITGFTGVGAASDGIYRLHLDQTEPAIAWTGSHYVVVWTDAGTGGGPAAGGAMIRGAIYAPESTGALPAVFSVCDTEGRDQHPVVACDPARPTCIVAWQSDEGSLPSQVHSMIFNPAAITAGGNLACAAMTSTDSSDVAQTPAIAFGGSNFALLWSRHAAPLQQIAGLLTNDASGALTPLVVTAPGNNVLPRVAYGSAGFFAVWENATGATTRVEGGMVGGAPVPLVAAPVSTASQHRPDVAFDGTNYVVAWSTAAGTALPRIEWVRFNATGGLVDLTSLAGPTMPSSSQTAVALASDGAGLSVLAYTGGSLTWVALLADRSLGASCGATDDCAAGVCVGGVCSLPAVDAGYSDANPGPDGNARDGATVVDAAADAPAVTDGADSGGDGAAGDDARPGDDAGGADEAPADADPGNQFHGGACRCAAAVGGPRDSRGRTAALGALGLATVLATRRRRSR